MSLAKRTKTLPNFPNATSQPKPPSRSAETIAHNDDLLTEILLRLPIKSLFNFKSVSKHWLSLISDHNFTVRRNSTPVPVSSLFFPRSFRSINDISEFDFVSLDVDDPTFSSCKSPFRSIPFDDVPFANEIVQSCSGLLLCFSYSSRALRPVNRYIVYNPTTKQYTELPPISPIEDDIEEEICGISLAFDPSHSAHYKVVCVRNSKGDCYQIQIYSSETRCWRLSGGPFSFECLDLDFRGGVYCNGCIHWIDLWEASAYFNVDEERFSPLPTPPFTDDVLDHDRGTGTSASPEDTCI